MRAVDQRHREYQGDGTLAVRTQGEVARLLGMTQQSVKQIESTALAKIRRALEWEAAARRVSVNDLLIGRADG